MVTPSKRRFGSVLSQRQHQTMILIVLAGIVGLGLTMFALQDQSSLGSPLSFDVDAVAVKSDSKAKTNAREVQDEGEQIPDKAKIQFDIGEDEDEEDEAETVKEENKLKPDSTNDSTATDRQPQREDIGIGAGPPPHDDETSFARVTCTPEVATIQQDRITQRFKEWWSHSACPDQVWLDQFPALMKTVAATSAATTTTTRVLDIGCNKGYTSADFMDLFLPSKGMNPKTLHEAISKVEKEDGAKYDRSCGVCNDCKKPLNTKTEQSNDDAAIEIHCFEPSPITYDMLTRVREKLEIGSQQGNSSPWKIHNLGLHEKPGTLAWDKACQSAVGDELCGVVPEDTPDSIKVDVVSVDQFIKDTYPNPNHLIHMLKIDAEGLDPAVLQGAEAALKSNRVVMIMYEFNPGLRDKDPPYGMWGKGGTKTLLGVTEWLDDLNYDCYLDSRVKGPDGVEAPPLYRITGGCFHKEQNIRGWANVVCASRAYPEVAKALYDLSPMVHPQ